MSLIKNIKNKVQCMYFLSKYKIYGPITDFTNQDKFGRHSILLNKIPKIIFGFPYNNIEVYDCFVHYYEKNNYLLSTCFDLLSLSQSNNKRDIGARANFDSFDILIFLKRIINYKIKNT